MSQERESRIYTIPPPSDDDPEEWRNLPEDLKLSKYQVSSLGRIKNIRTSHILSTNPSTPTKEMYIRCTLFLDDKTRKHFSIHILVAKTFLPNEDNKETVNHINIKKKDNRAINLEWSSYSEQNYKENKNVWTKRGKPVIQRDLEGNFIKRWEKVSVAEKELCITHISDALCGRIKTSGGFIWEYCEEDNKDFVGEIWKKISEEYDAFVSNFGRIRKNGRNPHYGTSLESGYYRTSLFNKKENIYKNLLVHRLVCQAFLPNPDNKPMVNHLDENKSNNKLENLIWTTHSENTNHSLDLHERIVSNSRSRIVLQMKDNKIINEYPSLYQASIKSKFCRTFIENRCIGKYKQKGEFVWIFKTDMSEL
jgi:hypothetical protein